MKKQNRLTILFGITIMLAGLVVPAFLAGNASAAQITVRSLTLQAGATDGGSEAGGVVNHLFGFTIPTTGNVGSIQFLYCTTASGACTTPTGLVTTSSTYGTETGATGFSLVNTTNGAPYITRTAASISSGTAVTYQLQSITNPTTADETFYVRISTFASTDTTGGTTDTGTVAASTATQIDLSGTMPESLVFCAGGTVSTTAGVPDCSTATSGSVSFNQLFSPTDTATATSQMAASTNAGAGYAISVNGPTLTSGSNTITTISTAGVGIRGTSQFGMNLKANTTTTSNPAVGSEVAPAANGTNYKGQASTDYDTVDNFKFVSGNTVAASDNGGAGGTDAQIFTASYIVNVPGSQPAGTYTTTLTYICTPTF
ncbi:MAG TPA: hypothetical protein VFX86_03970 [Candidatus Saccharimonadales bacterium]|nr:hypothetical protein [Candidatus Saccharimonadales bacterium]